MKKMRGNETLYLKRLIGDMIDFVLMGLLFLLLHFCLVAPVCNDQFHMDEKNQLYFQTLEESFLYDKEDSQYIRLDQQFEKGEISSTQQVELYVNAISCFYQNNEEAIAEQKWTEIKEILLQNENFYEADQKIELIESYDSKQVLLFLEPLYQNAVAYFLKTTTYQSIYKQIHFEVMFCFFLSSFLSSFILMAVVPLFRKDGASIGKMIQKLQVVSLKKTTKVKKYQLLIRYLFFYIIQLIIPFCFGQYASVIYTLPLMITLIIMTFSKDHLAIHDYIARTKVKEREENTHE